MREAVVIQMTWPGAPTIYYGDEAGVCGFTDPDNRRTYPWGHEDMQMIQFHKDIIALRKKYPVLRNGSIKKLGSDYNFIAYGRFDRNEQCVILINNNNTEVEKEISVWEVGTHRSGKMRTIFTTDDIGYSLREETYPIHTGMLRIKMPKTSAMILHFEL